MAPSTVLSHDTSADFQTHHLQLHLQIKFWFEWDDRYTWLVSGCPGISPCVPKGGVTVERTYVSLFQEQEMHIPQRDFANIQFPKTQSYHLQLRPECGPAGQMVIVVTSL